MSDTRRNYMVPRGYDSHKYVVQRNTYCITELYDSFRCDLVKQNRKVYFTDPSGRKIRMFDEFIPMFRFLKIQYLKIEGEMIPYDTESTGQRRLRETHDIVSSKRREPYMIKFIATDLLTFDTMSYAYRRTMMDYYLPADNDIFMKNPILTTATGQGPVDHWFQWAKDNNKDGICIYVKNSPYAYYATENYLVRRV